jgi:DNA mismatch repair protein MutL
MKIKFLSESTINRIAAGEVIERPASVVKELVENAIDAASSRIDIILEQAGKNLIIIADNGTGMSEKDLRIAVERHTTSKLDESDLLNIHSFGFRGEALPSIGSVSKMLIISKACNHDRAYQIQFDNGNKEVKPAIHNEGTKIEIRDLFFTTPARLKFLRADKTELAASVDIVKKIALAHPHISINLSHDGKNLIKVKGQKGERDSILRQRIADILGNDFIENSVFINLQRPKISLYGFTSLPTFNRASSEDQYLFVNNRPVKDKLLQIALRVAYQDYLARDRFAATVLFLQIDPQLVDVNVHPAKTEVRFHDPNNIRGLLISAIKDALATRSQVVSTNIATTALGFFQNNGTNTANKYNPVNYGYGTLSDNSSNYRAQNLTRPNYVDTRHVDIQRQLIATDPQAKVEILEEEFKQINENDYILGAARAQLHSTYIISQTTDSIIIVDQHAAHERLGYEKIKQMINDNGLIKQRLLIPEIVELPDVKRADLLNDKKEELFKLGLTIEKFGDRSVIISEAPSLVGDTNISRLIQDLADNLSELGENISLRQLIEHVTETYACHYSVRAGRKLSSEEMNELLRQMEKTPFSGQCNHGRPTYIELKLKDIERLFGRK